MGMAQQPKIFPEPRLIKAVSNEKQKGQQRYLQGTKEKSLRMKKVDLGLTNEVNTCFINSALQCLLNIRQLAEYYLTSETQSMDSLNKQINNLVKAMWQDEPHEKYPRYQMKNLYRAIVGNFELYSINYHCQMDSPEFIQNLLNFIRSHPLKTKSEKKDIIKQLFQGKFHTTIICKQTKLDKTGEVHTSCDFKIVDIKQAFLTVPLAVLETNQIKQKSQPTSNTIYSNRNSKSLRSRYKNYGSIQLETCLRNFSKEVLFVNDDSWYCKSCKKDVISEKQMNFYQIANILIIQLLIFQGETKLERTIKYPEWLQQSCFQNKNDPLTTAFRYRLIGVICHLGSTIKFGHYTSFTYDQQQKKWYRQSDSITSQAYAKEYLDNQNAYVLFYRKVQ